MPGLAELFSLALRYQQAGQSGPAENLLQQILALAPGHGGAHHLLGTIAYQAGRFPQAAEHFRRAAEADPANAFFHSSLGAAYQALGRHDEAVAAHHEAQRLRPGDPSILNNLGITLVSLGRKEEAVAAFRQALQAQPTDPDLLCNLAAALNSQKRTDEAVACYRQALQLRPDFPQALNNLGNALSAQGKPAEALACYQRAVQLAPRFGQAFRNLGNALQAAGKFDDALQAYRQALLIDPADAEAHHGLGNVLLARNRNAEALTSYLESLRLRPDYAEAHNGAGNAYYAQGQLDEAAAAYEAALGRQPDFSAARYNLGVARQAQGRLKDARACFEEALRLNPGDHIAHSTYLGALVYDPNVDAMALLAEHRGWAGRHASRFSRPAAHENLPDPECRLRLGYVSPDFRSHAVAYFLEPVLARHDRRQVEVFAYAEVAAPDAQTNHLRGLCDHWRSTVGQSDDEVAAAVRRDRIDVLIDLAGHTAGSRLLVFARKPAPVQVSYLGYPATTGLNEVDYRLVDDVTEPAGGPAAGTEEAVRLPGVFCCYAPPLSGPPVAPLPAEALGRITFGSLHKLEKLNPAVLDLWARLLERLPSARLLIVRNTLRGRTAEDFLRRFEAHGVPRDRILLRPVRPVNLQHLRAYDEVDISLDPFPWNGHTTACESLWMGVPVVALRGGRHSARMVASILANVGLDDWVADSPEDYVEIAAHWAADLPRLAGLRRSLRGRVGESPLCDAASFARNLEQAYRRMWRQWCASGASVPPIGPCA